MQLDHGGTIVNAQGLTSWQGARSIMYKSMWSQGRLAFYRVQIHEIVGTCMSSYIA